MIISDEEQRVPDEVIQCDGATIIATYHASEYEAGWSIDDQYGRMNPAIELQLAAHIVKSVATILDAPIATMLEYTAQFAEDMKKK